MGNYGDPTTGTCSQGFDLETLMNTKIRAPGGSQPPGHWFLNYVEYMSFSTQIWYFLPKYSLFSRFK